MPKRINPKKRSAVFIDLNLLEYKRTLDLQIQTLQSKIDQTMLRDRIFFVEHLPVFTLGKRGGKENLSVSKDFLNDKGIDVVQTDRGGNITYHGPGQAVMYPIVDLEKNKIGVKEFVHGLEEIMKQTAADFDIDANRDKQYLFPPSIQDWLPENHLARFVVDIAAIPEGIPNGSTR